MGGVYCLPVTEQMICTMLTIATPTTPAMSMMIILQVGRAATEMTQSLRRLIGVNTATPIPAVLSDGKNSLQLAWSAAHTAYVSVYIRRFVCMYVC